jgi:hypothetical protein
MRTLRFRALAAIVLLGATLAGAAPATAQGFNFGFGFGPRPPFSDLLCANNSQVRQLIARKGFTDIFLNAIQGRYIQVRATKGSWVYLIQYDRCSKVIVDADKLRRAK